jgi:hypothetical protein
MAGRLRLPRCARNDIVVRTALLSFLFPNILHIYLLISLGPKLFNFLRRHG